MGLEEKKQYNAGVSFIQLNNEGQYGLSEDWLFVEDTLKKVIPVYDKTNRYISLGTDIKIRKEGLDLLRKELGNISEFSVIDLGSGTGKLTQLLGHPAIMVDALEPMMKIASKRNADSSGFLAAFENLPFRAGIFRAAMAGFAIRDARNLEKSLSEICEIIQDRGFFLIVDLSKPDSKLRKTIIGCYWRFLAPVLAFVAAGPLGLKFGALSTTYQRLPRKSEFVLLLQNAGFDLVESKSFMLGGASVQLFRKRI
jgi:demethylmenaquinone methyltransferase/2-methoxy-6-polyprenyl-1,4-benzoquinol methylase